ncbi:MAG: oligosaccharide flippase family protein [Bacteroidales bacterium]
MAGLKSLAKDTAIYGLSSIVGRFLNWCLVPMYVRVLTNVNEYGIVTNLYGWTAFVMVLLTFGMETGFFRFANKPELDSSKVYSSSFWFVGLLSVLFLSGVILFIDPIAGAMDYQGMKEYILMMAVIVVLDAVSAIPFAYLRYKKRPIRFVSLRLLSIFMNILLNIFVFLGCPAIYQSYPELISWFYHPEYSVGYIFAVNLFCSVLITLLMLPEYTKAFVKPDWKLMKQMVSYCFPLLILGIAGILSQTIDKMLFPFLFPNPEEAMYQLGIYGANFKIAVVMVMFIQAFRFAYEPFVFAHNKGEDKRPAYAEAMFYFVVCTYLIFLGVTGYMDLLKFIVSKDYYEGLKVVPVVMLAEMCFGIFFNLSFWYKLCDKTQWGAYFSVIGCAITVLINVLFVPHFGYMASAVATLAGYAVIMIASYVVGQRIYPIRYDMKRIGFYTVLFAGLYACQQLFYFDDLVLRLSLNTVIWIVFVAVFISKEIGFTNLKSKILKH